MPRKTPPVTVIPTVEHPATLDAYFERYGQALGVQAAAASRPLHVPGRDPVHAPALLRPPFEAQAHVITAGAKALERQQAIQIAAEPGTGKTLISQAIVQAHAHGRGYRALVFCPPHLIHKWEREIKETLENAHVHHIQSYHDLTRVKPHAKPFGRGWWIVSNTRAKMGAKWRASYDVRKTTRFDDNKVIIGAVDDLECPRCRQRIEHYDKVADEWEPIDEEKLHKKKHVCEKCQEQLWQHTHEIDRWPVAAYIHKKLPGWFQYLIIDESHQTKSADTAIGQAMGSLVAACDKTICLTGTLLGGYAWHVRPLLYRIAPRSLIDEGLGWSMASAFDERYGRLEYKTVERENRGGADNRQSRGKSQSKTTKYVRPGVMPTLFGRHLIQNAIFLSLDEVADNLPPLNEEVIPVEMDPELAAEYLRIEGQITAAVKQMLARKDKRLLSTMLHVLLGYPDHPWGWGEVGYYDQDEDGQQQWVHVVTPKNLPKDTVRQKESALLELLSGEWQQGRKCWVGAVMTDKRDINARLHEQIRAAGLRCEILRSSVETGEREAWIAEKGPLNDAIVSHPQLVETGLDLFDKRGSYNFPTIIAYQTGYSTFTLKQFSRRSWRIGQTEPCRIAYLYYAGTMQARALTLMGRKLAASSSMEGKFSAEGLAAMAGDEGTLEMAMARSLVEKLGEDLDVGRAWTKLGSKPQNQNVNQTALKPETVPETQPITEPQLAEEPDWLIPPSPKKERAGACQPSLF